MQVRPEIKVMALLAQAGAEAAPTLRVTKYPVGVTPPVPGDHSTETLRAVVAEAVSTVGGLSVPVFADPDAEPVELQYANAGEAAAVAIMAMRVNRTTVIRADRRARDS